MSGGPEFVTHDHRTGREWRWFRDIDGRLRVDASAESVAACLKRAPGRGRHLVYEANKYELDLVDRQSLPWSRLQRMREGLRLMYGAGR